MSVPLSVKQKESINKSNSRLNLWVGPVRSGKSYSALWRFLKFIIEGDKGPLIICGRTDSSIKRNVIRQLQDIVGPDLKYFPGKREAVIWGRVIDLVGANDERSEAKIRGSEYIAALMDEITIIPESFTKMLFSRLSRPNSIFFGTTNPDSPFHWLKKEYIDRKNDLNLSIFEFKMDDNPSLSEQYKIDLRKEYQGLWYQRYIEGRWVLADGAVYDFFDDKIHVIDHPPGNATYYVVGIDYGTSNPCVFTMIGYNSMMYPNIWLEKEYYYDSKQTNRQKTDYEYGQDLIGFISGYNVKAIYIDPSATSFKSEMRRNGVYDLFDADNDVLGGIRFQAQLLSNGTYKICSNCVNTLKEYNTYLWDHRASDRGEDKPIKKNDHCFAAGTLVTTVDGYKSIELIEVGDLVKTKFGFRKVLKTFNHEDDLYDFCILGRSIKCTSNHRFMTLEGWKESSALIGSDILFIDIGDESCKKSKFSTELSTESIQCQKIQAIENISERINQIASKGMDISIEMYGNTIMEKFQKDTIFITGMGIHTTTALAISNVSIVQNIFPSIQEILQNNRRKLKEYIALKLDLYQKNGIQVKKVKNGTENTLKGVSEEQSDNLHVKVAQNNSLHLKTECQNFVRINVNLNGGGTISLITRLENVSNVVHSLEQINTKNQKHAQNLVEKSYLGRRNVYNLMVECHHEYFAEDILVSNCCDSQRYALFSHFFPILSNSSTMTEEDADKMESMYSTNLHFHN